MSKRTCRADVDPPEIAALERAILQASEERWACHGVDPAEAARLRPGVAALAKRVCDQLRAEYGARVAKL